jgi:hypothetical protein
MRTLEADYIPDLPGLQLIHEMEIAGRVYWTPTGKLAVEMDEDKDAEFEGVAKVAQLLHWLRENQLGVLDPQSRTLISGYVAFGEQLDTTPEA